MSKNRFEDIFWFCRQFVLKIRKKLSYWIKRNQKSLKLAQKLLDYFLQWYWTGDWRKFSIYFWKLDVNVKLKEQIEKIDIASNISKSFMKISDFLNLKLVLRSETSNLDFFYFWTQMSFFSLARNDTNIWKTHLNETEQIIKLDF